MNLLESTSKRSVLSEISIPGNDKQAPTETKTAPLKFKIFKWDLPRGVILTKDNLAKRNWQGSKRCC